MRLRRVSTVKWDSVCKSWGFPGGTSGKELACQCRRCKKGRFNPWVGKTSGGGHTNTLQYSCWENPMDRGTGQAPKDTIKYIGSQRVRHNWSDLAHTHTQIFSAHHMFVCISFLLFFLIHSFKKYEYPIVSGSLLGTGIQQNVVYCFPYRRI